MPRRENPLLELSIEFALEIIAYCELLEEKKKYVVSKQLLKSGTSIGANIHEAQSPESRADFIHKLKISDKEANETEFWLILCNRSKNYPDAQYLLDKLLPIQKLLSSILGSSKRNN